MPLSLLSQEPPGMLLRGGFPIKGQNFRVLDTAGIRKKKKVVQDVEYYSVNRAFKTIEEADIILLLIDVNEGLTEQDKKITQQIVKKGKGVLLVLNKWDTTGQNQRNLGENERTGGVPLPCTPFCSHYGRFRGFRDRGLINSLMKF